MGLLPLTLPPHPASSSFCEYLTSRLFTRSPPRFVANGLSDPCVPSFFRGLCITTAARNQQSAAGSGHLIIMSAPKFFISTSKSPFELTAGLPDQVPFVFKPNG